jgi:molybdopterin-guanine dinucleotide biosynthesis protein A
LERAEHPWLAVLAVDLPAMSPAWFGKLRQRCAPGVGVVGRRGEFFEPLAAFYPREFKWLAWEALVRAEYSLQTLLSAAVAQGLMRVAEISADESVWFENWNEPAAR